ncbi:MAG: glycosyltransferase family 39 protein [Deltaproteobacteria bacterium]|nr:glycosyltransferase family 39 protein [Deltaproteobacteria bacterium]
MHEALFYRGLTILLLTGLWFCVSGTGRFILGRTSLSFSSRGEELFFSTGIGFGILGYAVFALGLLELLLPLFLYLLVGLTAAIAVAGWLRPGRIVPAMLPEATPARGDRIALLLLGIALVLCFMLVLTPEVGKDALSYHLAVPKLFLKHQGMYFIPGNIFSNYPLHGEMLFLVGLFLQDDTLAKGLHFLALICILLGIRQFIRFRMKENRFPALSMLVFCTIPTVFITSTMAYNDLLATYYCLAAVFAFITWSEKTEAAWLVLCGLFTGLALATKYTALLLPLLGCLGILWFSHKQGRTSSEASRRLLLYCLATIIAGSPFYIRNWIMTGNPFYPFLYALFGGKGWEPAQARFYDLLIQNLGMGRGFLDYLLLPWNLSFRARLDSPWFDGIMGPLFLFILPFALAIRRIEPPLKIFLTYCGFTFLFWTFSAQQLRYLMPVFPFLAILVGAIFSYGRKNKTLSFTLIILIAISISYNGYHISRYFLKIKPAGVVTGSETREDFLKRLLPSYEMFQYANQQLPPDAKIFLIYMKNRGFLLDRDYYSDSMFESYTMQKILSRSRGAADVRRELQERGFTHILYDGNFVLGDLSVFSPQEKTLFLAFQKKYLALIAQSGSSYLYRMDGSRTRHFLP